MVPQILLPVIAIKITYGPVKQASMNLLYFLIILMIILHISNRDGFCLKFSLLLQVEKSLILVSEVIGAVFWRKNSNDITFFNYTHFEYNFCTVLFHSI